MYVGGLHQALQQRCMRFTGDSALKSGEQRSNRQPRSDFAIFVAADSIGKRKQPAVTPRFCRRVWNRMA